MTSIRKELHEQNRRSWNEATRAHNSHKKDQAAFLRGGGSTLEREETDLLGDIRGQKLVHLQCNSGQDTLSLAQIGAIVTGVDISDEAISFAQNLSKDSGIEGTFVRSDVYDWLESTENDSFDIAFCSYGALMWLSDLNLWGRGIARILKPGGRFVVVDAHPFMMILGEKLELKYPYSGGATVEDPGVHDYVADAGVALAPSGWQEGVKGFKNSEKDFSFQWGMAEIVTSLCGAGLRLVRFEEYSVAKWRAFSIMIQGEGNNFVLPPELPQIPMLFGLVVTKT